MKTLGLIPTLLIVLSQLNAQEPFKENGLYGIKNEKGEVLEKALYKKMEYLYSDGEYVYKALKDKQWYLLSGETEIERKAYDKIEYFPLNSDLVYCVKNNEMDILSLTTFNYRGLGILATDIQPNFDINDSTAYTIYLDKKEGLFFLDQGTETIPAEYDDIFVNDESTSPTLSYIARNKKAKESTIIDSEGKIIAEGLPYLVARARFADSTEKAIVLFSDELDEGYLNLEKGYVIPPGYSMVLAHPLNEDFIIVTGKKGEGIYWKGELILAPKYNEVMLSDHADFIGEISFKDRSYFVSESGDLTPK